MNKSFKTPAGLLAGNHIGKSADGAPIQPMLPSGYPMPKMVERESTGVQCPSAESSKEELVH